MTVNVFWVSWLTSTGRPPARTAGMRPRERKLSISKPKIATGQKENGYSSPASTPMMRGGEGAAARSNGWHEAAREETQYLEAKDSTRPEGERILFSRFHVYDARW